MRPATALASTFCAACLHVDDRKIAHCPNCGSDALGRVSGSGYVLELPGEAGMPCQACLSVGRDLRFRYFKHVIGMVLADRISGTVGYICPACVRRQFGKHMLLTLTLGWWGLIAFFFRNPFAIATNLWGLVASPLSPGDYGAIHVNAIRQAAEESAGPSTQLLPDWLDSFSEDELRLILTATDYYGTLGVAQGATDGEIKAAWRARVKLLHPDTSGVVSATAYDELLSVNGAYHVLRDARLRAAYDRARTASTAN